ncbi:lysine N(6)-hydroxylase/L-ornithine N(5)-oxygenase family protein [Sutcliffiella horikoshii]|uniref:Lysine N(6)-hydroxylase/L-ornithine N(5)-oxygenase family protein n=1 Tax=Sutcliffiella horikoshii TaxID=79883 RepID=A0A5D4T1B4_9BACI|nr:FAD/NAD(P)-binding protein [Sutcliffiella horikoshii]TYS69165.1 lysine N(6)-hydroxylase/L-ornithine N(5)-oxygenase family protein [Sutcliffiella horikoshii]
MLQWIIIGGGIQGLTVATFLLKKNKTTINKLRIIDPNPKPLENWKRCTSTISMPYLRSPSVHHLDKEPFSLQAFSKKEHKYQPNTDFYGRYKRPSLQMFNDHCDHLINDLDIQQAYVPSKVRHVEKGDGYWKVYLENGEVLRTEKVVIAIGISDQLHLPEWASNLKKERTNSLFHVFDKELPPFEEMDGPFVVVGGGITATHLAIKLANMFPGKVTMLKRHPFRVHDFDSNPEWLGPKMRQPFVKMKDYENRRKAIKSARHKGSIPSELRNKINHLVRTKKLTIKNGVVNNFLIQRNGVQLLLENGETITGSSIIMATGFEQGLPGREWLEPVIKQENLPCAKCGYPIVNHMLEWAPNLYVSGALAELEVGPIARNISGARVAANIISSI